MSAGHGGVSGRYAAWRERAFDFAWLIDAKSGEIVGFDVDIANEIAKRLDREPVMQSPVPFDALIQGLKAGKYDVLVASHGITAERKKQVDFSRPYYRSGAQTFIGEDETSIESPTDLKGKKIGAAYRISRAALDAFLAE